MDNLFELSGAWLAKSCTPFMALPSSSFRS